MEIILHRINSIDLLKSKNKNYGIEIDIRSYSKNLILNHDPFYTGDLLSEWLKSYNHGTLILNVKEEGLEEEILFLLKKNLVESYFFLDQSFPSIFKNIKNKDTKSAIRISDYESVENAFNLEGKIDWIWLDIFDKFVISKEVLKKLKRKEFKVCLASPELNNTSKLTIRDLKKFLKEKKIILDAVCTKFPHLWEE